MDLNKYVSADGHIFNNKAIKDSGQPFISFPTSLPSNQNVDDDVIIIESIDGNSKSNEIKEEGSK